MPCTGSLERGYWNASVNNKLQADDVELQLHGAREQDHTYEGSLGNLVTLHKTGIWHPFVHTFYGQNPKLVHVNIKRNALSP